MTIHEVEVGLTTLEPNSFEVGTKGSYGLYQLHLTFSDDWDGFTKKISFFPAKKAAPVVVSISDSDYYIDVPSEATAYAGICNFIVSGVMTGKAAITLPGTLTVEETKVPATTPAGSPTPSEIAQIYLSILGTERLPIPDDSGHWKLWDYTEEEYVVSEYPCRGTQGIQGIQGVQGVQGNEGQRGSRLTTGTSITGTTPTGVVFASSGITDALIGDLYINTATDNVYQCLLGGIASVATWAYICNIKGATGKGISTIARTSGDGSAGTTDTYTITYTDSATTTFTVTHGADGTDGTRGSRISQGTAITGTAVESTVFALSGVTGSLVGDIYINTSTYNYYTCMLAGDPETATWSYSGCIKGADGAGAGDMLKSVYDPNNDGNISADIVVDGATNKAYTATEKTKLSGIAIGATAVTVDSAIVDGSENPPSGNAVFDALAGKAASSHSHTETDLPNASTSAQGVSQLSDSTSETSSVKAATPTAVKSAYDLANAALPKSGGTMTGPIVQGSYINLSSPSSDHTATGNVTNAFQSGYTASAFDLVYMGSASKWLEVDADAVATCKGLLGIALEAKNDTQAMLVALPGSFVRDDTWAWTVGATLYAGETLGSMQETIPTGADAVIKVVGFAVSADVIYFNPSPDQQTTVA